jgi:hypothetical protein
MPWSRSCDLRASHELPVLPASNFRIQATATRSLAAAPDPERSAHMIPAEVALMERCRKAFM